MSKVIGGHGDDICYTRHDIILIRKFNTYTEKNRRDSG